MLIIEDCDNEM